MKTIINLSSPFSFIYKFLFPVIMVIAFAIFIYFGIMDKSIFCFVVILVVLTSFILSKSYRLFLIHDTFINVLDETIQYDNFLDPPKVQAMKNITSILFFRKTIVKVSFNNNEHFYFMIDYLKFSNKDLKSIFEYYNKNILIK